MLKYSTTVLQRAFSEYYLKQDVQANNLFITCLIAFEIYEYSSRFNLTIDRDGLSNLFSIPKSCRRRNFMFIFSDKMMNA